MVEREAVQRAGREEEGPSRSGGEVEEEGGGSVVPWLVRARVRAE